MNHLRRTLLISVVALLTALGAGLAAAAAPVPREVLVLGGTGQLGAEIVRRLLVQGDRVTVFTRPGSDRSRLTGLAVGYAEGDLLNEADVTAAFAGNVLALLQVDTEEPAVAAFDMAGGGLQPVLAAVVLVADAGLQ